MRAVLFVVSLLAAVSLSSANQCRWGPSFWCLNNENAAKCGQVRYCQQNIWTAKKVDTPQNDIECEICKFLVNFLDKFVDSNKTEDEAKELAEKVCSTLGSLEQECKDLIDEFFPTIWKLLEEEMEPDKICAEIKLCSENDVVKVETATESDAGLCDVCKLLVSFADKFIDENSTEAEAEDLAKKMCSALGSLEDECKQLIDEFFPMIWKLLENETDPDTICKLIGLCPKSDVVKVETATESDANLCDVCKFVVTFLDKFIDENSTEEEAKAAVEKLCDLFGSFQKECTDLVNDYFPLIWELLEKETEPDTICSIIGLCSTDAVPKVQAPQGVVTCTVCEMVVKFLEPYIENNKTENETKQALDDMCNHLGLLSDECKSLVDKYFPKIWAMFQKETNPDEICSILGLCSSSLVVKSQDERCDVCKDIVEFLQVYLDNNDTEETLKEKLENFCKEHPDLSDECGLFLENFHRLWTLLKDEMDSDKLCYQLKVCASLAKPSKKSSPDDLCSMCKLVVNFIAMYVDNNATEEEVKAALDKLCELLPGDIGGECKSFVDSYFDTVWALMESELENDVICFQLRLCSSDKPNKVAMETPGGDIECDVCKFIVRAMRPFVNMNSSEGDVKKALQAICDILPSKYKDECNNEIAQYFDLIWGIMKQEVDDGQLCCLVQLCQNCSSSAPNTQVTMKVDKVTKPEFILCELCELIMEKLESMLVNNATEAEIIALVDKICDVLPEIVRKDCDDFINKYGKDIIQYLVNGEGAKAICTLLGVCVAAETSPAPGGDATKSFSFNMNSPGREEIDTCAVCEVAVEFLKDILKDNYTEGAIVEALDLVCSKFPSGLTTECKDFVDEYAPEIIQLIDKDIVPKECCELIDACPKTTSSLAQPWKMIQKARNMLQ